jgi:hypothetical protein
MKKFYLLLTLIISCGIEKTGNSNPSGRNALFSGSNLNPNPTPDISKIENENSKEIYIHSYYEI